MREVRRDQYGRYLIKPIDGGKEQPHTRATTVADTLEDGMGIGKWRMRHAAKGLAQRDDLLALVAATPAEDKAGLNSVCDQAVNAAAGDASANLGTALHALTEQVDRAQEVEIPPRWQPDIDAYLEALVESGITIDRRYIEAIIVNRKLSEPIAGTTDRLIGLEGFDEKFVFDIKTGSLWWTKIAVQLAIYANGDSVYRGDGVHDPMPDMNLNLGIVAHLPAGAGRCELYAVDIAAGWEAVQRSVWARAWRKRRDLAKPLAAGREIASELRRAVAA